MTKTPAPSRTARIASALRVVAASALLLCSAGTKASAAEVDATAILKAMTDYMTAQQTISLSFDSDIEVITPQMEKIQFTNSGPNRRIFRRGADL
jgi:hypothetical protein